MLLILDGSEKQNIMKDWAHIYFYYYFFLFLRQEQEIEHHENEINYNQIIKDWYNLNCDYDACFFG